MGPSDQASPGRLLAIDYGRRRMGVAASDPLRVISQPRCVVSAGDPPTRPTEELLRLVTDLEAAAIVVGIPRNMDGSEGEMAKEAREFARHLGSATGVRIIERDERLSTVEADRAIRELGVRRKKKRRELGLRDMMAAAILLEDYMQETRT